MHGINSRPKKLLLGSRRGLGLLNGILLVQPTLNSLALGDRHHSLPADTSGAFAVFRHEVRILVVNQNQAFLFRPTAVIRIVDFVMVVLHWSEFSIFCVNLVG
jgi:hypothetical protein